MKQRIPSPSTPIPSMVIFNLDQFVIIAYIDPGSGSILLQVILASCIGGIAVFWSRIKALFTGKKPSKKTPGDEPSKSE